MENFDLFRDIAERTGGDIYIGAVGPARTGKSTFIKKFMEALVLPNIADPYERERTKDALPQSGGGRTIMTTEPKFIPDEAVEITIKDNMKVNIRMVDCVGYTVPGALGYEEADGPRMVLTPWYDHPISFQEAAEIGTRKVIAEHSTIGLVIVTDGTITDIPRENYIEAEQRVINELKELQKPFLIIMNSTNPNSKEARELAAKLEGDYDLPVLPVNCAELTQEDIYAILQEVLYEFPVKEVNISLPKWIEELEGRHWLRAKFEDAIHEVVQYVRRLRDIDRAIDDLNSFEFVEEVILHDMDLGTGLAVIEMTARNDLFYQVLEEITETKLEGEHTLLRMMKDLVVAKREYDKVVFGLEQVRATGYGIISPSLEEMILEEPEVIRQGARFGVRLRAIAPSIHLIRTDVKAEISPIIGTEKQSEEFITYMMSEFEGDPQKIWRSQIFGKTLNDLVRESISGKLHAMPENAQQKMQETLTKIVNEGNGGLICIIF